MLYIKYLFYKLKIFFGWIPPQSNGIKIKRIWFDPFKGELYLHTNCRSGLFTIPIEGGKRISRWMADIYQIDKLPKNETIYKLRSIEDIKKEDEK